jgi:hypothetical protein
MHMTTASPNTPTARTDRHEHANDFSSITSNFSVSLLTYLQESSRQRMNNSSNQDGAATASTTIHSKSTRLIDDFYEALAVRRTKHLAEPKWLNEFGTIFENLFE